MAELKRINSRAELQALATELGIRHDWHEPDNQDVDAFTFGGHFDNAGFWGLQHWGDCERRARMNLWNPSGNVSEAVIEDAELFVEMFVVLYKEGRAVAEINLATLFAFACGTFEG